LSGMKDHSLKRFTEFLLNIVGIIYKGTDRIKKRFAILIVL
jgi:hypothetical protein